MPATPEAEAWSPEEGFIEVHELFCSISGEGSHAGCPATFLRTSGCNLRCTWCDTERARGPGRALHAGALLQFLLEQKPRLVILTGGEPLCQAGIPWLAQELLRAGRRVSVETNGSLDIEVLPPGAHVVLDMKAPSSEESERMDFGNLSRLRAGDDLKIIIADRRDFDWACELLELRSPAEGVNIFLSPAFQRLKAASLADWLIDSGLPARLQIQLHKVLWPGGGEAQILDWPGGAKTPGN